jgi:hypothetical protein
MKTLQRFFRSSDRSAMVIQILENGATVGK